MKTVKQGLSDTQIFLFRGLFAVSLALVIYLAVIPVDQRMVGGLNDKVNHLGAFFILAMLADFSFARSPFGWHKIGPLMLLGLLIEIIQYFLQYRTFSIYDVLAGWVGILLYVCSPPLLKHLPVLQARWR